MEEFNRNNMQDIVSFIENTYNIKLYNYQKLLLKEIAEKKNIYYIMPPKIGRKYYLDTLYQICEIINLK